MHTAEFTGVVLAGGRSSRMGRDKALLDWQGRPLIEHMMALLREAGAREVVVSGDRPDYRGIPDASPGGGPLIGLLSVADALPEGELLVVPVDMPRLPVALLRRLMQAPPQAWLRLGEFALPLRLRLDSALRTHLHRLAAASGRERSLQALQAGLRGASLSLSGDEAATLDNCNTPADWTEALSR